MSSLPPKAEIEVRSVRTGVAISTSDQPCQATLAVITIATTTIRMVAFMLPRCATRRKLDIQRYIARAGRQIAMLFEQAA